MLAGGILGYPRHIGRAETGIMYAGDAAAFAEHGATLADLAGAQRYLGEDPGPPNAVYVSAFGFYFAALAGFLEAAALAAERGVRPSEFAAAMPGMAALLLDHIDDAARRIEEGDYAGDQATVDIHLVGSTRRQRTFAGHGLQSLAIGAFVDYCRQAQEAGEGGEDIAALFKRIVRRPPATERHASAGGCPAVTELRLAVAERRAFTVGSPPRTDPGAGHKEEGAGPLGPAPGGRPRQWGAALTDVVDSSVAFRLGAIGDDAVARPRREVRDAREVARLGAGHAGGVVAAGRHLVPPFVAGPEDPSGPQDGRRGGTKKPPGRHGPESAVALVS